MTARLVPLHYGMKELNLLYHRHAFTALGVAIGVHGMFIGVLYIFGPSALVDIRKSIINVGFIPRDLAVGNPVPAEARAVAKPHIRGFSGLPIPVSPEGLNENRITEELNTGGSTTGTLDGVDDGPSGENGGGGDVLAPSGNGIIDLTNSSAAAIEKYPVAVREIKPDYPEIARRIGAEGIVVVKLLIDKNGKPQKAEIFSSENDMFNEAAISASMKWLFTPAIMNKGTVAVWAKVPFRFRLNRQ